MPGKPRILSFSPTRLINSIKHEQSCKILYICIKESTRVRSSISATRGAFMYDPLYLHQGEHSCKILYICIKESTHVRSSISATRGAFMYDPLYITFVDDSKYSWESCPCGWLKPSLLRNTQKGSSNQNLDIQGINLWYCSHLLTHHSYYVQENFKEVEQKNSM